MARRSARLSAQRTRRILLPINQGDSLSSATLAPFDRTATRKRPHGNEKERPRKVRKSECREVSKNIYQSKKGRSSEPENCLPSEPLQSRKRSRHAKDLYSQAADEDSRKRPRPSSAKPEEPTASGNINRSQSWCISFWAEASHWPKEFFQQDHMEHLVARKKSATVLRRKRSDSSLMSNTPSDQTPREEKSTPYKHPSYQLSLERQGDSYMREDELGVTATGESLCQSLLQKKPTPKETIFRDDVFKATCDRLQGKNEARIIKDITPLIVPSAEPFAILGAKHLDIVAESVNEGWNNCIPITKPRPQPDYAVGFRRSAFSNNQLRKLQPFLGNTSDVSYFMATYYMCFPFLTCEVKCGATGLDIADRQNAHNMTVALKGVVELFMGVNRGHEIHRQVLGFSVSHDHEMVRIWAHYPVINKDRVSYWRYSIRKFDFTERRGLEKWTAYNFTANVYNTWVSTHFKRICSAIDDLPLQTNPASLQRGRQNSRSSGLSQPFENQVSGQGPNNQLDDAALRPITPVYSTNADKPAPKKTRKREKGKGGGLIEN